MWSIRKRRSQPSADADVWIRADEEGARYDHLLANVGNANVSQLIAGGDYLISARCIASDLQVKNGATDGATRAGR